MPLPSTDLRSTFPKPMRGAWAVRWTAWWFTAPALCSLLLLAVLSWIWLQFAGRRAGDLSVCAVREARVMTNDADESRDVTDGIGARATLVAQESDFRTAAGATQQGKELPAARDTAAPHRNAVTGEDAEREAAPGVPPTATATVIQATAWQGSPVGVAQIRLLFRDDQCPQWNPDTPLVVEDSEHRVRFPAIDVLSHKSNGETKHLIQHAELYFLFVGNEPFTVHVASPEATWIESYTIVPQADPAADRSIIRRWSRIYRENADQMAGPARFLRLLSHRVLARRLSQGEAPFPTAALTDRPMATLEKNFERTVSTLLGIDSLLLAVPDMEDVDTGQGEEAATLPLPSPLTLPSIPVPAKVDDFSMEELALHVPQDCFYARCQSVRELAWMRGLMKGWGGNLQDILALPSLDYKVRARLEEQLALGLERSLALEIDETVADMALVGGDLFFREGAAIGVVLQASDSARLREILLQQREEAQRRHADVRAQRLQVNGEPVSALTTPDNSVRSFYAIKNGFHLITNSMTLLKEFLAIDRGRGSLGRLPEFRYARGSKPGLESPRMLIYLSDPFFRRLASPQYRIELIRRAQSLREMHEFAVAHAAAASLGEDATTAEELVRAGYLPRDFGRRTDNARIESMGECVVDSLRGRRGTFLPIPDVPVARVSRSEWQAYTEFASGYQRQWGRVDPLTVTLDSALIPGQSWERVNVHIWITPYARQRYAFFTRHLAPPTAVHASAIDGDVLRVDAALRDANGKPYQMHLGLQDQRVTYRLEEGRLVRTDVPTGDPLTTTNQYVAVSPGGIDGLKLVHQFVTDLQSGNMAGSVPPSSMEWNPLLKLLAFFLGMDSRAIISQVVANNLANGPNWSVYASNKQIREFVLSRLHLVNAPQTAQVRLTVDDPNQAEASDYLHAYAYVASRSASGNAAQMLNDLTNLFGVSPEKCLSAAQYIFDAAPACPLKGRFEWTPDARCGYWRSSVWRNTSIFVQQDVPPDYRFPFLDWLHGASVEFSLSRNTLAADAALDVRPGATATLPPDTTFEVQDVSRQSRAPGGQPPEAGMRALEPGDRVIVRADRASLRLGQRTTATLPRNTVLTVLEVHGNWVGVSGLLEDTPVRGWIHERELARK